MTPTDLSRPDPVHAGLLVPWANTVMEFELPHLSGRLVAWHVSRMVPANRGTRLDDAFLAGLQDSVPACVAQFDALPLKDVFLGCTSASFDEALPDQPSDRRVITAFGAIVDTLRRHDLKRIHLLTPYSRRITEQEAQGLKAVGITVDSFAYLDTDDHFDQTDPADIAAMAHRLPPSGADALVISCTNLPSLDLLDRLEADFGFPVISSNRAVALMASGGVLL